MLTLSRRVDPHSKLRRASSIVWNGMSNVENRLCPALVKVTPLAVLLNSLCPVRSSNSRMR
ncbi:hypothetical protein [Agrobacterium larrymoorei]|uniref:Uncharacterized protein n=1 Tax=Agrobacterium larrymoorei TaxID=160699 RepID=A0ABU0UIR7_9HYPH|nr:hypothetical protein [Agrobacterium larrymoorei]MDQ1184841.1 hypothetical protein [Agrobacterium larrymoorei]